MITLRSRVRVVLLAVAVAALALPASGGAYVYWANYDPNADTTIGRANLDGTGVNQSFIPSIGGLIEIAVDGQHIYWANTPRARSAAPTSTAPASTRASSPAQATRRAGGRRPAHLLDQRQRHGTRSAAPTSTAPRINKSFITGGRSTRTGGGRRHTHLLG